MKLNFGLVFRAYILLLAGLLVWSIWSSAQVGWTAPASGTANNPQITAPESPPETTQNDRPAEKRVQLTFGLDGISFLRREYPRGIALWLYVASLIYVLLAVAAAQLLDWIVRRYLRNWAVATKTKLDNLFLAILDGPIKAVAFVILLNVGLERFFTWPQSFLDLLRKALAIVVAVSLTYMSLRIVEVLMSYWKERASGRADQAFDEQLFPVVQKTLKIFLVVVAVLLTCDNLGLKITSVLASLSIGGLALGLAAQDTLANLFGAVAVFADKPFRIGDRIKLESIDGVVENIGLRSTRVRNLDGHLITIPNKTMGNATITNVTRRPNIKTEMNIGITYDTPTAQVAKALSILNEIYRSHPMTADLIISFDKFADSSLNLLVVHWWNSTDYRAYLGGMQELNLKIKERFDAEGISFAFPTQTLYLKREN